MKSATAIAFDYRPSRWIAAGAGIASVLAPAALVLSGMPLIAKVIVGTLACTYAAWSLRAFLRPPILRVTRHAAGHWRIADINGGEHVAEFERGFARGGFIVLRLRRSNGRCVALVLGPDNSDREVRRRLRVQLARVHDTQKNPVHLP